MKIAQRKHLNRIIIVALLTTLLTFNVGRVQSVKAVGTTIAAAAGATLCAVGIAYYSYLMLTGAQVRIPSTSQAIQDWLTETGRKVVQYPSGRAAYEELYPRMLRDPSASLIHDFLDSEVWTWTTDKIKLWANDFSSTDVAGALSAYYTAVDAEHFATNGFTYPAYTPLPDTIYTTTLTGGLDFNGTISQFVSQVSPLYMESGRPLFIDLGSDRYMFQNANITWEHVRNVLRSDGKYGAQYNINGYWENIPPHVFNVRIGFYVYNDVAYGFMPFSNGNIWRLQSYWLTFQGSQLVFTYPVFPTEVIYDEVNQVDLPMVEIPDNALVEQRPQWPILQDPDDEHLPVIPYYQTPWDPNWIDPVTGNPGGGNWGFGLDDLLDLLEQLAEGLIDIGILKELINDFAEDSGDTYYISYDDSVTGNSSST